MERDALLIDLPPRVTLQGTVHLTEGTKRTSLSLLAGEPSLPLPTPSPLLQHRLIPLLSTAESEQSMGARNRIGLGLSYRPARLHTLAESIP
jgi:hypothetical protein